MDLDGLVWAGEHEIWGTNPWEPDTDYDGLTDYVEVIFYGTDPFLMDTDGDGLDDVVEVAYGTDPLLMDTDGDGINDKDEIDNGQNPFISTSTAQSYDTDGDLLSDFLETNYYGTDPTKWDSDGDGINDRFELFPPEIHYPQPNNFKFSPSEEPVVGFFTESTDPLLADSNGNGLNDFWTLNKRDSDSKDRRSDESLIQDNQKNHHYQYRSLKQDQFQK